VKYLKTEFYIAVTTLINGWLFFHLQAAEKVRTGEKIAEYLQAYYLVPNSTIGCEDTCR